jgi:Outer membrane protein Omp28
MKNFYFTIIGLVFFSCKEIAPTIPPLGDKKVLIEEFTGVRCVNCPAGASEIENLKATYGDRLIVISIHAGDFAPPYSDSKFDFRTTEGVELEKFLGAPLGYPSAVINRKKAGSSFQAFRSAWPGLIADESNAPSVVSLGFNKTYDVNTRDLNIDIKIIPTENITDARISVALTENGIKDQQETPQGKQSDYTHKHVLRKMLSKFDGDPLSNLAANTAISKNYALKIPQNWQIENCRIVAFIHKGGEDKKVLQVVELKIND